MKKSALLLILALICAPLFSQQNCTPWFPFEEGTAFEYTYYNKKDKVTSIVQYKIENLEHSGNEYKSTVSYSIYNKKGEEVSSAEFEARCIDGVYTADFSNFVNPQMMEAYGDAEVTITGDELMIPRTLKVGQTLPDVSTHMEAKVQFINLKLDAKLSNRKVEAIETVVTPVKEFEAYKISVDEYTKVPLYTRDAKANYYYAEGYGQVKYESFDKKGNAAAYMLLTKFEKP